MQLYIDKLGKVAVTVEKNKWSNIKDYDKLTIVEGPNGDYKTFISRKPVPAGTPLTDRTYWIPFSSLREEIVLDYNTFVNIWTENLRQTNETLNNRITNEVDALSNRITQEIDDVNLNVQEQVQTLNSRISRERNEVNSTTANLQRQINNNTENLQNQISENDADIAELYNAVASVVAGGVALLQGFGNRTDFGISQKVLTESRDDLQAQINAIIGGNAEVNLTVTPSVVFADNTDKEIIFIATSTPTKALITFDNQEPIETTRAEFNYTFSFDYPTTISKTAAFSVAGVNKGTKTATVTFVYPIYFGSGADDSVLGGESMIMYDTPTINPSFTRNITTEAGDYIYIEIPDNMRDVNKIQLYDNPTFPTDLSFVSVSTSREGYKAFKTVNERSAGTHSYKIS